MTRIDSVLASALASRIDTLIDGVAAGARTAAAQTGASTQAGDMRAAPVGPTAFVDMTPTPSAQARLSEVGLTLDAISRFGGEATPPLLGEAPIWPSPPAIDAGPAQTSAQASGNATGAGAVAGGGLFADAARGEAAAGSAAVAGSATLLPVAALAAALERTVATSGVFYESHLARWAAGSYPSEALVEEPQTRLAAQAQQLALDWEDSALSDGSYAPELGAWLAARPAAGQPGTGVPAHAQAAQWLATALAGDARADAAAYATAWQLPGLYSPTPDDARGGSHPEATLAHREALPGAPPSVAASIHPATIPLVRQQLDLLATQQFRWSGEVWPGTKLDWSIEEERRERRGGAAGGETDGAPPAWRTRLTLALPTLGTVDADLVLTGAQLVVRVQASPVGAARLTHGQTTFGQRLEAAGLKLAGLSIREIGGAAPGGVGGQAATSAYARAAAAAAATDAPVRDVPSSGRADSKAIESDESPASHASSRAPAASGPDRRRAGGSPLDGLFDDPFDWGGV